MQVKEAPVGFVAAAAVTYLWIIPTGFENDTLIPIVFGDEFVLDNCIRLY